MDLVLNELYLGTVNALTPYQVPGESLGQHYEYCRYSYTSILGFERKTQQTFTSMGTSFELVPFE